MLIKKKMLLAGVLLAVIPVAIVSFAIEKIAQEESSKALRKANQERLIATRDLTRSHVEDYFQTIEKQVQTFSANRMVISAAKSFKTSFVSYQGRDIASERAGLANYYQGDYLTEYQRRNAGESVNSAGWLAQLDDNSVALQYRFIQTNPNPLGEKHKLDSLTDGSAYSSHHKKYHPVFRDYLENLNTTISLSPIPKVVTSSTRFIKSSILRHH